MGETMQETARPDGVHMTTLLLGGFDAIHKLMDRTAAEAAHDGWSNAAEAAVDILEDLGATFAQLRERVKDGDGPEAVIAVRDTLRLVEVNRAAETAKARPVRRDATRDGLARQIQMKREQLARMARTVTEHTGIPHHDMTPANTLPHPVAASWRAVERDTAALVRAWDVL